MKKAYYYLFYTLYRFFEKIPGPKFWSEVRAAIIISVLEIFIIGSIDQYYTKFISKNGIIPQGKLGIYGFLLIIVVPKYFIFYYQDIWKVIVDDFDGYPKRKNRIAGAVVLFVMILIIANFIFACNL